jgi:hypothetical protein
MPLFLAPVDPFLRDVECSSSDVVGNWVYNYGPLNINEEYQVRTADITDPLKTVIVGVLVEKDDPTSTFAVMRIGNEITDFYSGLVPGKLYFLRADQSIDPLPPSGSGEHAISVGVALSDTSLEMRITHPLRRS